MISRRDVLKGAAGVGLWAAGGARAQARQQSPAQAGETLVGYVDPFIGTGGGGHTFPGAAVPGGLVQLSPDSGRQGRDWRGGYHYSDTDIAGFSHTHLSGSGVGDLCDILVTPTQAGAEMPGSVASPFSHEKEKAFPGYYSVDLGAFDIRAELTATRRVGLHRYSFLRPRPGRQPAVSFDLGFAVDRDEPVETGITLDGPTTISGYRFSTGWAKDQRVFFVARISRRSGEAGARAVPIRAAAGPAAPPEGRNLAGERGRRPPKPRARGAGMGVRRPPETRGDGLGAQAAAGQDRDA